MIITLSFHEGVEKWEARCDMPQMTVSAPNEVGALRKIADRLDAMLHGLIPNYVFCSTCAGVGTIPIEEDGEMVGVECFECHGEGQLFDPKASSIPF